MRTPGAAQTPAPEAAPAAAPPASLPAPSDIIVGGTPAGDVIVMSPRALALVRAGLLVKAFVIAGLASLRRTIALGGNRMLRLEYGIYQLA